VIEKIKPSWKIKVTNQVLVHQPSYRIVSLSSNKDTCTLVFLF